jgi:hypothetical protein
MQSGCYFRHIKKRNCDRQMPVKIHNKTFHENLATGNRVVPGWTDRHNDINIRFSQTLRHAKKSK